MRKLTIATLSFLLLIPSLPSQAAPVTAAGGATLCDQTVGSSGGVSAYQASNGDCVVEFRTVGSTTWTVPSGVTTVTYLVVAGGGGGAGGQASEHGGGGGGAGGVLTGSTNVSSGNLSIVVGGGGSGGAANGVGTAGGNSSFAGTITSTGGGRGGTYFTDGATTGGSGGGAGAGNNLTGANGTAGQGTKGGNVTSLTTNGRHGAGGGGASTAGGNTVSSGSYTITAGAGGDGLSSSITGTAVIYGGGGGGGGSTAAGGSATGGASGGAGGGGNGATYNGTSLTSAATAGSANTGGGGGGGIGTGGGNASAGAAGGSGIIIIRYVPAPVNASIPTISGFAEYGETLTAGNGSWLYSPTSYTYQWMRASTSGGTYANISGATSSTYYAVAADIAQFLKVVVTASNANGSAASTSAATSAVIRGVSLPTINLGGGDFFYRTSKSITATVSSAGKLTFNANRESIPGCKNLSVTAANSYSRTCNYRPSIHGMVTIAVIFTPTDSNYDPATSLSAPFRVKNRVGNR
jgi:hypothetical protein